VSKTGNFLPAFSDTKIRQAMKAAGGHVKTAAAALGVDFSSFYARLKTMRDNGSPVITAAKKAAVKKKTAAKKKR
jgi:DNA-binding NtrC family response regulator